MCQGRLKNSSFFQLSFPLRLSKENSISHRGRNSRCKSREAGKVQCNWSIVLVGKLLAYLKERQVPDGKGLICHFKRSFVSVYV